MLQLSIIGNLGRDAEIKASTNGEFVTFTVAVNRKYRNKEGVNTEETHWVSCITSQTSIAEFLRKGTKVYCAGNLSINKFISGNDQQEKMALNLRCQTIQLLSPKPEESKTKTEPTTAVTAMAAGSNANENDDLPF